jgi:hypothetical protein
MAIADNESRPPAESHVTCKDCNEQNKPGSTHCARCGAVLPDIEGAKTDGELRAFNAAQAELAEKLLRERRRTVMIDILQTGGSAFKPR